MPISRYNKIGTASCLGLDINSSSGVGSHFSELECGRQNRASYPPFAPDFFGVILDQSPLVNPDIKHSTLVFTDQIEFRHAVLYAKKKKRDMARDHCILNKIT